MATKRICVARIGAPHGVRGALKLWPFTEDPLAVLDYGPLSTQDGSRRFEVETAREAKDHLVATLKGVASRDDAVRLNGIELYIDRDQLPETDEGEYYHADLIGLAAVTAAGEPLAKSPRSIISAPATSSRSRRPPARRCCCRSPMRWCRRSTSKAAAW